MMHEALSIQNGRRLSSLTALVDKQEIVEQAEEQVVLLQGSRRSLTEDYANDDGIAKTEIEMPNLRMASIVTANEHLEALCTKTLRCY